MRFWKVNLPKATKYNQKNYKKLGQRDNQRSRTALSQTSPGFSLLIAVVKNNFAEVEIIFSISHLASTLNLLLINRGNVKDFIT